MIGAVHLFCLAHELADNIQAFHLAKEQSANFIVSCSWLAQPFLHYFCKKKPPLPN